MVTQVDEVEVSQEQIYMTEDGDEEIEPVVISQDEWSRMFDDSGDEEEFEGFEAEELGENTYHCGDNIHAVSEDERAVLMKLRDVFGNGVEVIIRSLKAVDRKRVMAEVRLVDGLLHNLIHNYMTVTDINRLLYAGSFVVADRLGLLHKTNCKTLQRQKLWWQRRLERSIVDWRKDLARIQ